MIKKQEHKQSVDTGGQPSLFACTSRIRQKLLSDVVHIKNNHPHNITIKHKQTQLYEAVLHTDKHAATTQDGLKSLVIDTTATDVSTVFSALEGGHFPDLILAVARGNDAALIALTSLITYINGALLKGCDLSDLCRYGALKERHPYTCNEALAVWCLSIMKRYSLPSSFQHNLVCLFDRIHQQNDKVKAVTFLCDGVTTNTVIEFIPTKDRGLDKQMVSSLFEGCQAETAQMVQLTNGNIQVGLMAQMDKSGQDTLIKCLIAFDARGIKSIKKAS